MINRYDKGFSLNIPTAAFSTSLDLLGKALAVKQKTYEENEAMVETINAKQNSVKALAGHREIVGQVFNGYDNDIYGVLEKHNGDYSMLSSKLSAIKRQLSSDMAPNGILGKVQNYYDNYSEWDKTYKNDKDIDLDTYQGMKAVIHKQTWLDKKMYDDGYEFDASSELFVPLGRSDNFVEKETMDKVGKFAIDENGGTSIVRDDATDSYILSHTTTKTRGGQQLMDAAMVNVMNSSDFKANTRAHNIMARYGMQVPDAKTRFSNIVTTAYNSAYVNSSNTTKSMHGISQYTHEKEKGEEWAGRFSDVNFQPDLDPMKHFDFWNEHFGGWTNKVGDNGQIIGKDGSFENIRKNKVNTFINNLYGNRPAAMQGQGHPLLENLRSSLMNAKSPQELDAAMKVAAADSKVRRMYQGQTTGVPIVISAEKNAAMNWTMSGIEGAINTRTGERITKDEAEKMRMDLKNNEIMLYKINDGGVNGVGFIDRTTGDKWTLQNPDQAYRTNQQINFGKSGQQAISIYRDKKGNVQHNWTVGDLEGNIYNQRDLRGNETPQWKVIKPRYDAMSVNTDNQMYSSDQNQ